MAQIQVSTTPFIFDGIPSSRSLSPICNSSNAMHNNSKYLFPNITPKLFGLPNVRSINTEKTTITEDNILNESPLMNGNRLTTNHQTASTNNTSTEHNRNMNEAEAPNSKSFNMYFSNKAQLYQHLLLAN